MTQTPTPLRVILSVVHNRMFCDTTEYREFLDKMAGRPVDLWDVGPARREVARHLIGLWPQLADFEPPSRSDTPTSSKFVKGVAKKLGWDEAPLRAGAAPVPERTLTKMLS